MNTKPLSRALGLALALATLAGCNANMVATTTPTGSTSGQTANQGDQGFLFGPGPGGAQGGGMMGGGMNGLDQYMADLDLTAEQQAAIQAIAPQGAPGQPGAQPSGADLQALLTAATLDVAAIRAAVAEQAQAPTGGNHGAMYQAYYDILTASQRTALVAALEAAPAQPAGMGPAGAPPDGAMADVTADLALSVDQQAAYDAFQAKVAARGSAQPGRTDPAVERAATIAFFQSGDESALNAALSTDASAGFPVDELLALATSLSVEQRTSLFSRGVPGLRGGFGGPGGAPQV